MVNSAKIKNTPKKTSLLKIISRILLGLFLTILTLEASLRASGFIILHMQEHRNLQSIKQKDALRIMCLGESTTQNQYPVYLEEVLNQRNIGIKFSVIDKGVGGTNTAIILAQLEVNLDKYKPDIVVTMMGINDEGRHIPYEKASASKIALTIRSFKIYKLARFLRLHIITKYTESWWFYTAQGKLTEAEDVLKKVIKLNSNDDSSYRDLGWLYRVQSQRKFAEAEKSLKKAIELNPKNDSAYAELGWIYRAGRKFVESEEILKKAIELNPKNDSAYKELGWLYRVQGKFAEAEESLKKAIELNPSDERLYGRLAIIYRDMGSDELSKMYAKKANNLTYEQYKPMSVNNYYALKQILDKRKIRLVCVQYPMRSAGLLKNIFMGQAKDNVIFVDNEKIFKDVVMKEGYKEYFRDMVGGDFGHCTEKGNRLLAENIANVILKEYFNK